MSDTVFANWLGYILESLTVEIVTEILECHVFLIIDCRMIAIYILIHRKDKGYTANSIPKISKA